MGLLCSCYVADGVQLKNLEKEVDLNYGAVYENAVAEELKALQYPLYYYNSKKNGDVDFLIEIEESVVPIEV